MHTHRTDLLSLTFGVVLTGLAALFALSLAASVPFDLSIVVPVALITAGGLVGIAALVRRPSEGAEAEV